MKSSFTLIASLALAVTVNFAAAAEPGAKSAAAEINQVCPISGKPVNPKITMVYEGKTYAFAEEACRTKWRTARENSLYHKLGGQPAIDAAVEAFYVKVLADNRIKHYFEDINMTKQRRKQKEFLSAAFGGPIPWAGKDMRKAHANLPGLNETHFNAVAENLQKTLEDLKIKPELIKQVMAIAASTRNDVLNRPKDSK
jgi:hemoglobin